MMRRVPKTFSTFSRSSEVSTNSLTNQLTCKNLPLRDIWIFGFSFQLNRQEFISSPPGVSLKRHKTKTRAELLITSSPASAKKQMFADEVISQAVTRHLGRPIESGICFGIPPHHLKLNGHFCFGWPVRDTFSYNWWYSISYHFHQISNSLSLFPIFYDFLIPKIKPPFSDSMSTLEGGAVEPSPPEASDSVGGVTWTWGYSIPWCPSSSM